MIEKLIDKNSKSRKRKAKSKEAQQRVTYSAIFFFKKPKEDLAGGTMAAKTSPPPYDRSGAAGTRALEELGTRAPEELEAGAPEELVPDDRLLQNDQDQKSKQKGGIQQ